MHHLTRRALTRGGIAATALATFPPPQASGRRRPPVPFLP